MSSFLPHDRPLRPAQRSDLSRPGRADPDLGQLCHKLRFLTQRRGFVISTAYQCHKSGTKQATIMGYARVSTEDQNSDLQLTALKRAGCGKIFTDKATGMNTKRPALGKCLKALKAGDVL